MNISTTLRPSTLSGDEHPPTVLLKGPLTYDADASLGSGTFRIGDYTNSFKGPAWVTKEGLIFDGTADDDTRLYVNLSTDPQGTGSAILCPLGTQCEFFTTLSGTVLPPME